VDQNFICDGGGRNGNLKMWRPPCGLHAVRRGRTNRGGSCKRGPSVRVVNQPYDDQLGNLLLSELGSGRYSTLTIAVAFAKLSGVLRIKPGVEEFREAGGRVVAFVGIDLGGTSLEALIALFYLCDELYVVHTESPSQTFHPKVYDLKGEKEGWLVVGSNNLTGGGLWTNFECFSIAAYSTLAREGAEIRDSLDGHFNRLADDASRECIQVVSEDDILALADEGYVDKEIAQRISSSLANRGDSGRKRRFAASIAASAPPLPKAAPIGITSPAPFGPKTKPVPEVPAAGGRKFAAPTNEAIWFETRRMTGGSGNILDLSKSGTIESGSASGTRFETDDPGTALGGVYFFGVDATATHAEKDITVNLDGVDYYPCTVKIHAEGKRPNGSWRIQLRGTSAVTGESLERTVGRDYFKNKILVFEMIRDDYFALSVFPDSELDSFKSASIMVARNGAGGNSKFYGLL